MFKKKVKNMVALLMAALMLITFAACGKKENKNIEELSDEEIEEMFGEFEQENGLDGDIPDAVNDGKIDVENIIFSLEFNSYSGYGYVTIGQNWKDLVSDEVFDAYLNSVDPVILAESSNNYMLDDVIQYVPAENYNRLANGDTVYINAQITEEFAAYGITVDGLKQGLGIDFDSVLTYTVSDLPEGGTAVDIFTPVVQYIVYEGANGSINPDIRIPETFSFEGAGYYFVGDGTTGVSVLYNNEQVMKYYYRIEGQNLSAGDEFILKTDMTTMNGENCTVNDVLLTRGLYLTEQEKKVTVPDGSGNYVSSIDQLTPDRIESVKQILHTYLQNQKPGESLEFKGIYFAELKPQSTTTFNSKAAVFALYSSKYELFGEPAEDFIVAPAYDVIIEADGSLTCMEEYTVLYIEEFSSEAEAQDYLNNGSYACTKIG